MAVSLKKEDGFIFVKSPRSDEFVEEAKFMGGKWDYQRIAWKIPVEKESELREILLRIYDYDENAIRIVVKYKAIDFIDPQEEDRVQLGNKVTARRFRPKETVRLYDTVVLDGEFLKTGGSNKYPAIFSPRIDDKYLGVVLKSRISKYLYENLSSEDKEKLTIIG